MPIAVLKTLSRVFAPCKPGNKLPRPEACTPEDKYEIGMQHWRKHQRNPCAPMSYRVAQRYFRALLTTEGPVNPELLANVGRALEGPYHHASAPYYERAVEFGSRDKQVFVRLAEYYYDRAGTGDPAGSLTKSAQTAQLGLERTGDAADRDLLLRLTKALEAPLYPDREHSIKTALALVRSDDTRWAGERVLVAHAIVEKTTRAPMGAAYYITRDVRSSFKSLPSDTQKAVLDYFSNASGAVAERTYRLLQARLRK